MQIVEQLIFYENNGAVWLVYIRTACYNFMQTKLIFRGPAKSAMADSVWSRGGQSRLVQWYAKYAA